MAEGLSAIKAIFARENRFVGGIAVLAAIRWFLFGYDTGTISVANVYAARSGATMQGRSRPWPEVAVGALGRQPEKTRSPASLDLP